MNLKCVLFDLGYTLVYNNREQFLKHALAALGIEKDETDIFRAFHLADKRYMRECPGVLGKSRDSFMPQYFKELLGLLEADADSDVALREFYRFEYSYCKSYGRLWLAYENSANVLLQLRKAGIRTGLISNWDHTAREVLGANALMPLLDTVIISSEVDTAKPEKEIFDIALRQININPEDCLYVGDNYYDDVLGSRAAGMRSLLINPYEKLGIEEISGVPVISNISALTKILF